MTTATTTPMTTAVSTVSAGERSVGRGGDGIGRDTLASNVIDTGRCDTAALLDLQLIRKQKVIITTKLTHLLQKMVLSFLETFQTRKEKCEFG